MEALKYPVGKFKVQETYSNEEIENFKANLKLFPKVLRETTSGISDAELATPYREEGWTARQVVHHLADSHMNMMIRLKWTFTEDQPAIKAYHEDLWAELPDYSLPIEISLAMIDGIHARISALVENIGEEELEKTYFHPESKRYWKVKEVLALYSWHCEHHLAHINICRGQWSI